MTKNNRVFAMRLGKSETAAIEMVRWLQKHSVDAKKWPAATTPPGQTVVCHLTVREAPGSDRWFTVEDGQWVVVDTRGIVRVMEHDEFAG